MNAKWLGLAAAGVLVTACSSDPHVQNSALGGAALGALAGRHVGRLLTGPRDGRGRRETGVGGGHGTQAPSRASSRAAPVGRPVRGVSREARSVGIDSAAAQATSATVPAMAKASR